METPTTCQARDRFGFNEFVYVTCTLPAGHGPSHESVHGDTTYHWHQDLRDPSYLAIAHYPANIAASLADTRRGRVF